MNYQEIPEGSVLIQEGLYLYTYTRVIGGITRVFGKLYSAVGYCFYNLTVPENFDENGNLVAPENRIYATYAATPYGTAEEINAFIVSVPYQEGYEVVSVPSNPEHEIM